MGEMVFYSTSGHTSSRHLHAKESCRKLQNAVGVREKDRDLLWDDIPECSVCFDEEEEQPEAQPAAADGGQA